MPTIRPRSRRVAAVLRGLVLKAPPNLLLGNFNRTLGELGKLAGSASGCGKADGFKAAFHLFRKSAGETLDRWFESDPIKAVLGFDAVVGNLASPYTAGSAYVLLHHAFGEVNGKPGVWGHAIGGMGAITQAMAQRRSPSTACASMSAQPVREVIVEREPRQRRRAGRRHGVRARAVIANVNPQSLFQTLVPARRCRHAWRRA